MTTILAIDPGTTQSGWVLYDKERKAVMDCGVADNHEMLSAVQDHAKYGTTITDALSVEMIASYGMAVGREVFETCVWVGRFVQAWRDPEGVRLVFRQEVKLHVCGSHKAKDANVRQAIIDLFPRVGGGAVKQIGTKAKPGPLFGMGTHTWPALGVAIVTAETPWKRGRRRVQL